MPSDTTKNILSIFINNPQGDKSSVIWCLYNPEKIKKTLGDIPPGVDCFPQGKQKTPDAIHNLI